MRDYMLYKVAVNEGGSTNETKPDVKSANPNRGRMQLYGALGGGALGYLLTRYAMGLKGAGAGLVGAGVGAAGGALAGDTLADYGAEANLSDKELAAAVAKAKERIDESPATTWWRHQTNPTEAGVGGGFGLLGALRTNEKAADKRAASEVNEIAERLRHTTPATQQNVAQGLRRRLTPEQAQQLRSYVSDPQNITNRMNRNAAINALEQATNPQTGGVISNTRKRLGLQARRAATGTAIGAALLPALLAVFDKAGTGERKTFVRESGF